MWSIGTCEGGLHWAEVSLVLCCRPRCCRLWAGSEEHLFRHCPSRKSAFPSFFAERQVTLIPVGRTNWRLVPVGRSRGPHQASQGSLYGFPREQSSRRQTSRRQLTLSTDSCWGLQQLMSQGLVGRYGGIVGRGRAMCRRGGGCRCRQEGPGRRVGMVVVGGVMSREGG
ncbi:uncharacterized [Tachysurus ichikawai]